jgi:hypothetical protein
MRKPATSTPTENPDGTFQIELTKGHKAIIDREDVERVCQFKWTALSTPWTVYARRTWRSEDRKQHSMYLHRYIMQPENNQEVDHRDGDGRNCVRSNMRVATKSQNAQNQKKKKTNTSGTKGVGFYKPTGTWQAYIGANRLQKHLGFFKTKEEAIAARHGAARLLHKDFHKLE